MPLEPRPVRSSPTRMSHDLYFRLSESAAHDTNDGAYDHPNTNQSQHYHARVPKGHIGAQYVGDAALWSSAPALRAAPVGGNAAHRHMLQSSSDNSSLLYSGLPDADAPVNSSGEEPAPRAQPPYEAHGNNNISSHAETQGRASEAAALLEQQQRSLSELRVENRNMRMRLVFMDELMAKRNISATVMHDLVDARQEIILLKKQLAESSRQFDLLQAENRQVRIDHAALEDREASLREQNRALSSIPELQQSLRRVELERDDAITKVLTLQLEANSEKQSYQASIAELEERLATVTTERANTIALKEETIISERLANEARLQELTDACDEVKSDLRAMLEQRSEALHNSERDVDKCRAEISSLEVDITAARRKAQEQEDTIDELQRRLQERELELRRTEMHVQDSNYEGEKRTMTLETQIVELQKTVECSEDMLVVYKRALQYALDLLRGGSVADDAAMERKGGPDGVAMETSAISPPRNSPAVPFLLSPVMMQSRVSADVAAYSPSARRFAEASASPHVVTSTGAVVMASVLKNAIDDSARAGQHDHSRRTAELQSMLQRQLTSLATQHETLHALQETKLRRLSNRIADASDVTELCARRQTKFHLRLRGDMGELVRARDVLTAELSRAHQYLKAAAEDHEALRAELRRSTNDRETERQALAHIHTFLEQLGTSVQSDVRRAAEDTRQSVVQVRAIGPEFLESVRGIVRKSHNTVQAIHDLVDVAHRQYHQLVVTGGAVSPSMVSQSPWAAAALPTPLSAHSLGRSPSTNSRAGGAYSDAPRPSITVENLIQQLVNVCQLLENNLQQGEQSEKRLTDALESWALQLTSKWNDTERNMHALLAPLRHSREVAHTVNPHTVPADRQPSLHQQQQQQRLSSYYHGPSHSSIPREGPQAAGSKEPSPAPVPLSAVPTPMRYSAEPSPGGRGAPHARQDWVTYATSIIQ